MYRKMTSELAHKLNKALAPLNEHVSVNCGGCGVFAYYFAEALKKLHFKPAIIELTDEWSGGYDDFKENIAKIENAVKNHSDTAGIHSDSHFCVKVDNYYFDSKHLYEGKENDTSVELGDTYTIVGEVPINDIEYISIEKRGHMWNSMYDTDDNKTVKQYIDKALKRLQPKTTVKH